MSSPSGSSWRDGKILLIVAEKTPRKNVTGVAVTAKASLCRQVGFWLCHYWTTAHSGM